MDAAPASPAAPTSQTATGAGNLQVDEDQAVGSAQQGGVNIALQYASAGSAVTGLVFGLTWIIATFKANTRDHETFKTQIEAMREMHRESMNTIMELQRLNAALVVSLVNRQPIEWPDRPRTT